MELTRIEALLEKYEEGATSLAEEKMLKEYFANGDVPEHLWGYRMIFGFTAKAKKTSYPYKLNVKKRAGSKRRLYSLFGIAASLALALGVYYYQENNQPQLMANDYGTIEDPEEAYLKTKETLQMIAEVFNDGKEDLVYIKEFNKTKDKFINE